MPVVTQVEELLLIRHGESAGNVARDRALAERAAIIDIAQRDADVPLSPLGERQAAALGDWLLREKRMCAAIFCSPYVRARETAAILSDSWPKPPRIYADERLREREFGMLDRLTQAGIEAKFPDQAEMRRRLGKFYYRPPGGESWADVVLRLRSFLNDTLHECSGRVAIVSHQVVVLCLRYVLEDLDEAALLAIDKASDVANCSLTSYAGDRNASHGFRLIEYNAVEPVQERGEAVTSEPDVPVAPK